MRWCDDKDFVGRKWTLIRLYVRSSHSIRCLVMRNDFYDDHWLWLMMTINDDDYIHRYLRAKTLRSHWGCGDFIKGYACLASHWLDQQSLHALMLRALHAFDAFQSFTVRPPLDRPIHLGPRGDWVSGDLLKTISCIIPRFSLAYLTNQYWTDWAPGHLSTQE